MTDEITIILNLDEASRVFSACVVACNPTLPVSGEPTEWRTTLRVFARKLLDARERVA